METLSLSDDLIKCHIPGVYRSTCFYRTDCDRTNCSH